MMTFHYRLNGGDESSITVQTGIYQFAALAIPAITGNVSLPLVVEIWCPRLLPEYGPLFYQIDNNEFGFPFLSLMVQRTADRSLGDTGNDTGTPD